MEEETKDFLVAIMQTASLLILWMLANVIIGIRFKYGLFENSPSLKNYFYYAAFFISLYILARYLIKKWKKIKHF